MAISTRLCRDGETNLVPYLAAIHANCIRSDNTIATFLKPLDNDKLLKYWRDLIAEVSAGTRLIVLLFADSPARPGQVPENLMGFVTLSTPYSETGRLRGSVEKLLVSPKFRRMGGATALMAALEAEASRQGRILLMVDTETGTPAEEFYKKQGYIEIGRIPGYSISPGGDLKDKTFFYKKLEPSQVES